ncbi:MAG: hypothetical protein LCH98_18720 [Actinobacteria bacterium]|nr:hypothetical protein [Actinomycetota bacterium]
MSAVNEPSEAVSSLAERRAAHVAAAVHDLRLEGLDISPEAEVDSREYVAGRIGVDELVRRARARAGLSGDA